MSKSKARREAKRWLLWCTISDTPLETEEYLSEHQLRDSIKLDLVSGIRATGLRFQLLPERKKRIKFDQKMRVSGPSASVSGEKPLDTHPSGAKE